MEGKEIFQQKSGRFSDQLAQKLLKIAENDTFKQNYQKLTKAVFLNLIEEEPNYKILTQLQEQDEQQQFQQEIIFSFNVLLMTTTDFIRQNFVEDEIRFQLKELNFDDEFTENYIKSYNSFTQFVKDKDNEQVQNKFNSLIQLPQLTDIEWRQDFIVSNQNLFQINKDMYYINLSTVDRKGNSQKIPFRCTLEQLTELAHKVNVALKNIESTKI